MAEPLAPTTNTTNTTTPLMGRDRELVVLRDALAAALAGRGRLVLIGGEAGIGKSTLAEVVCREAAAGGALVLIGRCYDLTETPPYGPWVELFERLPVPDLAGLPAPLGTGETAPSQAVLFAQVRDALVALAARQPLVLLLDDVHWADPASLDLLRAIARQVETHPALLLATYRSDELTRRHPFAPLLPLLVREARATRLDLRPLEEGAVRALVAARYPLPDADVGRLVGYLCDRAEGNAFFLGEVLRALEEDGVLAPMGGGWRLGDPARAGVPPLLRHVIEGRVARLGDEAERLLAVAAVIGQEVPLALWGTVAGADEEALLGVVERAAEAHVLVETSDGQAVRFVHALIRDALYAGTSPSLRRAWHRRAGEALAGLAGADPDAVAHHFRQAGDPRAADWLVRAGQRAQRAFSLAAAAARYQAALALLPDDDAHAAEQGWLLARIGHALRFGDPRQTVAVLAAARERALQAGDRALAALALTSLGSFRSNLGERRQGLAELRAGIAELEALPAAELERLDRQGVTGHASVLEYHRRGLPRVLAADGRCAEALALAEQLDLAVPVERAWATGHADACHGLGVAHALLGHATEARRWLAEGRRGYLAAGNHYMAATLGTYELWLAALVATPEDLAGRERLAREALENQALAFQAGGARYDARLFAAPLWLVDGRWAEARAGLLATLALVSVGRVADWARGFLGWLAWARGEAALAREQVRALLPNGPEPAPADTLFLVAPAAQRLAAALALDERDLAGVRAWLATHDQWLAWSGTVLGLAEGQLAWGAYHRQAGDLAAARRHAEAALAHATEPRQSLALLAAHRLLGELDTAAGRHTDARTHLDAALALAEACAAPYERALTLLALAELRLATSDPDGAGVALDEARALLVPLDARPALARADALAARLAATPAPREALPAGLTTREVEVLRLVAQGLTNAQVAERLFLSPRTVDRHLNAVYSKLGVASRSAATRFAVEHGLG